MQKSLQKTPTADETSGANGFTMEKTSYKERIIAMNDALNRHVIDGIGAHFADNFVWRGGAGPGTKSSLKEFQDGWQRPFLSAFKDKFTTIDLILEDGDLVAAYGTVEATHSGDFLGMPATGKRIKLKYMDFWRFDENGDCVENWVHLDIIDAFRQMGRDLLDGKGWDDRR